MLASSNGLLRNFGERRGGTNEPELNTATPRNFALGYPRAVGAMMNDRFGEPFEESFEGIS